MDTSEKASELSRIRWGDKLSCRMVDRQGIRVAQCQWNGERFEGRGKDNLSALKCVFEKINELGKSKNTVPSRKGRVSTNIKG